MLTGNGRHTLIKHDWLTKSSFYESYTIPRAGCHRNMMTHQWCWCHLLRGQKITLILLLMKMVSMSVYQIYTRLKYNCCEIPFCWLVCEQNSLSFLCMSILIYKLSQNISWLNMECHNTHIVLSHISKLICCLTSLYCSNLYNKGEDTIAQDINIFTGKCRALKVHIMLYNKKENINLFYNIVRTEEL